MMCAKVREKKVCEEKGKELNKAGSFDNTWVSYRYLLLCD